MVYQCNHYFNRLPDNVSLEEGSLVGSLSVAMNSCKRANIMFGDNVLILGAGPIGLCTVVVASTLGANTTVVGEHRRTLFKIEYHYSLINR